MKKKENIKNYPFQSIPIEKIIIGKNKLFEDIGEVQEDINMDKTDFNQPQFSKIKNESESNIKFKTMSIIHGKKKKNYYTSETEETTKKEKQLKKSKNKYNKRNFVSD